MIEKIALTTPTFGYMEMDLIDPERKIYVADRVGTRQVAYDYDRDDQLCITDALDIFWDEMPNGLKEKVEYLWVPSVDQILGERCLPGFGDRNSTRVRASNDMSRRAMWWTSTSGMARHTHFIVDVNGGLISDEDDRREAGFLPAIMLKRDAL